MHTVVSIWARGQSFGHSLHLYPYFVYVSNGSSGDMRRLTWTDVARQCGKYTCTNISCVSPNDRFEIAVVFFSIALNIVQKLSAKVIPSFSYNIINVWETRRVIKTALLKKKKKKKCFQDLSDPRFLLIIL